MAPAPKEDDDIVVNLIAKGKQPSDIHMSTGGGWDERGGYHLHFHYFDDNNIPVPINLPGFDFNPHNKSQSKDLIIKLNGKEMVKFTSAELNDLNYNNIHIDPFIERRLTDPKAKLGDYVNDVLTARSKALDSNQIWEQLTNIQQMLGNLNNAPLQKGPPIQLPQLPPMGPPVRTP